MPHPKEEKTVVLVKPDGVKRGLVGEIIHRIEQRGLKIIALKMVTPTLEQARDHYPNTEVWMRGMGEKTLENYKGTYDASVIKKIKEEDGLIIGITNMDEFACGSSGENSAFGPTRNPINNQLIRARNLATLPYVDYIVIFNEKKPKDILSTRNTN